MNKKFRFFDFFIKSLIWLSGIFIFTVLISIIFFVFYKGLPSISWNFLITAPSELDGTIGILPMIINTIYIIVITLVISTPIGIFSAIYLNEYAGKNKLVKFI